MNILISKHAGYCYGVQRALNMARDVAQSDDRDIFTIGPIIHNPQVVESLKSIGIIPINSPEEIDDGVIIIRTHGVGPQVIKQAQAKGLSILDATCPFVKKVQQRAAQLVQEGYELVIVGEAEHPEVQAILSHAHQSAHVIETDDDIANLAKMVKSKKVGVVTQTTQPISRLLMVANKLLPLADETKIFNTICSATTKRQESAKSLAGKVDLMIVIGGKNSANTSRLAKICSEENTQTHHIEVADELEADWFRNIDTVGITAGASTPSWIMDEVVARIERFDQEGDQ